MRKIFICLLTLLLLFNISGCHGSKSRSAFVIPEQLSNEEINLTFWSKNDTNKAQADIYQKAVMDFEKIYSNVHITLKTYTKYPDIYNDVITNVATDTTPNICVTYPDHIATYITGSNVVVPLDELIDNDKFGLHGSEVDKRIVESTPDCFDETLSMFTNESKIDGVTYAMPFMRSTEAVYINEDYVKKLGYQIPDVLSWDFIFEVSQAAMEKDDEGNYKVNGQKVLIPFIYKSTDNMMIQYLVQKAALDKVDDFAYYSNDDGEIFMFDNKAQELLEIVAENSCIGSFSTFNISSYPANYLNAGQCIFAIDSTAGATWMGSDAPLLDIDEEDVVNFKTVVRMIPQLSENEEDYRMISQGPSLCIFNKDNPQEVLYSWLFVQYLLSSDVQIAYSQTEGYVPVSSYVQNTLEYQNYLNNAGKKDIVNGVESGKYYDVKIQASKLLYDYRKYCFVTPVFNGSASLREAAGSLIDDTIRSVLRKEYPESDNNEEVNQYYKTLFNKTISLKKLNQINNNSAAEQNLGSMPVQSILLLTTIGLIWVVLAIIFFKNRFIKKGK